MTAKTNESPFWINLVAQFAIMIIASRLKDELPPQIKWIAELVMTLSFLAFCFGLLYALCRAFGAKNTVIENFYDRFPLGQFLEQQAALKPDDVAESPSTISAESIARTNNTISKNSDITNLPLNLGLQLILAVVLESMAKYLPVAVSSAAHFLSTAFLIMFVLGLFYGMLRMFEVRDRFFEDIYQKFPISFFLNLRTKNELAEGGSSPSNPQNNSTKGSLIFVNLMAQLILYIGLKGLGLSLPSGLSAVAIVLSQLICALFWFGVLYACLKAFSIKTSAEPALEYFYSQFPVGYFWERANTGVPTDKQNTEDKGVAMEIDIEQQAAEGLSLAKILRVVGLILIFSAVASLLFNIHWQLLHKIILSFIAGIVLIVLAGQLSTKAKTVPAAIASLLSFAFFQFALTLSYSYCAQDGAIGFLASAETWLFVKLIFTVFYSFILFRFPADFMPTLYALIAYSSPATLLSVGAKVSFAGSSIYVLLISAFVVILGVSGSRFALLLLNSIIANSYVLFFLSMDSVRSQQGALQVSPSLAGYTFVTLAGLFILHLWALCSVHLKNRTQELPIQSLHVVTVNLIALCGLSYVQQFVPQLALYNGVTFVVLGAFSFAACGLLRSKECKTTVTELLSHMALIISALGFFVEAKGIWTAVIFLSYACLVLWYAVYTTSRRTKLYALIILIVSVVKLYLEGSQIFDSIPGSVAVLILGGVILLLSYKFEAIKDILLKQKPQE